MYPICATPFFESNITRTEEIVVHLTTVLKQCIPLVNELDSDDLNNLIPKFCQSAYIFIHICIQW